MGSSVLSSLSIFLYFLPSVCEEKTYLCTLYNTPSVSISLTLFLFLFLFLFSHLYTHNLYPSPSIRLFPSHLYNTPHQHCRSLSLAYITILHLLLQTDATFFRTLPQDPPPGPPPGPSPRTLRASGLYPLNTDSLIAEA